MGNHSETSQPSRRAYKPPDTAYALSTTIGLLLHSILQSSTQRNKRNDQNRTRFQPSQYGRGYGRECVGFHYNRPHTRKQDSGTHIEGRDGYSNSYLRAKAQVDHRQYPPGPT